MQRTELASSQIQLIIMGAFPPILQNQTSSLEISLNNNCTVAGSKPCHGYFRSASTWGSPRLKLCLKETKKFHEKPFW